MRKGWIFTFLTGLLIGGMAALIIWYYQKSTSAEDGALALLERLAGADRRLRQTAAQHTGHTPEPAGRRLEVTTAPTDEVPSFLRRAETAASPPSVAEELRHVKGIGPVFAGRLEQAGIDTTAKLTAVSPADLARILQISESRAAQILSAADA